MKAILLNDTACSSHPGCLLGMYSFRLLCKEFDINLIGSASVSITDLKPLYKGFKQADLIIVNGEGSIHDNNRPELIRVAKDFPSVLINTVFQNELDRPELKHFLYVSARESLSADELMRCGAPDVSIVPDLIFAHPNIVRRIYPTQQLGFTDSCEQRLECDIGFNNLLPAKAIEELSKYHWMCTGRFHGICLCAMLDIPFSAWASNTWKNEGIMTDMHAMEHYAYGRKNAAFIFPKFPLKSVQQYAKRAPEQIRKMFKKIRSLKK